MSGFRVSKNHASQYVAFVGQYRKLTWSKIESGGDFDLADSVYAPPPGPVFISAFIWISGGMIRNNGVVKLLKNAVWNASGVLVSGVEIATGIGCCGTFPGSFVLSLPGAYDVASEGDTYSLGLYADTGNVCVDGHPAHTWFSGMSLPQ